MRNQFVGDVGDFGKYGLLRAACGWEPRESPRYRLGVVWYFTADDSTLRPRHFAYLTPKNLRAAELRNCDSRLYDLLKDIRDSGTQDIDAVSTKRVLPPDAICFGETVPKNRYTREVWVDRALKATEACDLVFLDPDNGIATEERPSRNRSPAHVYRDEIQKYTRRGQSVVVYHHLGRHDKHLRQIARVLRFLGDSSSRAHPFGLWYRRGTGRVFFVMPSDGHYHVLGRRAKRLLASPWGDGRPPPHFTGVALRSQVRRTP